MNRQSSTQSLDQWGRLALPGREDGGSTAPSYSVSTKTKKRDSWNTPVSSIAAVKQVIRGQTSFSRQEKHGKFFFEARKRWAVRSMGRNLAIRWAVQI
jgi:hypothetical protein